MVRYVLGGLLGIAILVVLFGEPPGRRLAGRRRAGRGHVHGGVRFACLLCGYGAGRVPAISAALTYRLVSFWLAVAVGWVSVGAIAYNARRRAGAAGNYPDT